MYNMRSLDTSHQRLQPEDRWDTSLRKHAFTHTHKHTKNEYMYTHMKNQNCLLTLELTGRPKKATYKGSRQQNISWIKKQDKTDKKKKRLRTSGLSFLKNGQCLTT